MVVQVEIKSRLARLQEMAPAGYALGFHVRFTTPAFMFQTYDSAWLEHYSKNGLIMTDPIVHWGFENRGYKSWAELSDNDPKNVLGAAAEHGLNHGISWSVGDDDSHSLGGFARTDRMFDQGEIDELMQIVTELHNLTHNLQALSPDTSADLKEMSILYTHPAND